MRLADLPVPIAAPGPWAEDGLCRQTDPDLWHPTGKNEASAAYPAARLICEQCDVRETCLEYALTVPATDDHGMWGGTTPTERDAIRKERARAKRRKPRVPTQPKTCSVDGCERPHRTRGWCSAHWSRQSRYGDPLLTAAQIRQQQRRDTATQLLAAGAGVHEIAARLDTTVAALGKAFDRAGDTELARTFYRAATRDRKTA